MKLGIVFCVLASLGSPSIFDQAIKAGEAGQFPKMKYASEVRQFGDHNLRIFVDEYTEEHRWVLVVSIGKKSDAPQIDYSEISVSAVDQSGKPIALPKLNPDVTVVLEVGDLTGATANAEYVVALKTGQKLARVEVRWQGKKHVFSVPHD